jgi:hypothetical protein
MRHCTWLYCRVYNRLSRVAVLSQTDLVSASSFGILRCLFQFWDISLPLPVLGYCAASFSFGILRCLFQFWDIALPLPVLGYCAASSRLFKSVHSSNLQGPVDLNVWMRTLLRCLTGSGSLVHLQSVQSQKKGILHCTYAETAKLPNCQTAKLPNSI